MGRSRFFLPLIFAIVGIAVAILSIYRVSFNQPSVDLFPFIEGTLYTDIIIILVAAIPIIALEYFIIAIPLAILYLIGNSFIKAAAYETNIMKIGEKFGGIRMIRRAAASALFSASTAGVLSGFFQDLFVVQPVIGGFLYRLNGTLMASLVIMPIALALFMPTWILNDSGIVNHLRQGQLEVRQCPHTEGVGRWYSSMLGGYSILSFPIAMFSIHFLQPFIDTSQFPQIDEIIISLAWIAGIPLLIMAFIIPVILLNEAVRAKSGGFVKRFVSRMGADVVVRSQISRVSIEKPKEDETSER